MKKLIFIFVSIIFINITNAQNNPSKAFDKINDSKNINDFLNLEQADEIVSFSIALVIDAKLTAFPYDGNENVDVIFNKLKAELNNIAEDSAVRIIVADLKYESNSETKSYNNLVYNITDLPSKNTMAVR